MSTDWPPDWDHLSPAQEWQLLLDHVAAFPPPAPGEQGYVSTFNAAVREARSLTGRDEHGAPETGAATLWAGTLVYFALLDQIGDSLMPLRGRRVKKPGSSHRESSIEKALRQFAPQGATRRQRQVLYAVRCAFAHEFGLFNERAKLFFRVDDTPGGKLIIPARRRWSGRLADATAATQTTVNLVAVGDLVESAVQSVRSRAIQNMLRAELSLRDLYHRFGFTIVP